MRWVTTGRRLISTLTIAGLLAGVASAGQGEPMQMAARTGTRARHSCYENRYLFPLTRSLPDLDWHPSLVVPLTPFAFAVDVVEFPFGVLLGFTCR